MASSTVSNPIKDLHELLQKKGEPKPDFGFQEEEDGKKNKVFVCTVKHKEYTKVGRGSSKKIAQHKAAELLLQTLTSSFSTKRTQTKEVIGNTNSSSEGINQEQSDKKDGIPEPYFNTEEDMMEDDPSNYVVELHELLQGKQVERAAYNWVSPQSDLNNSQVFECTATWRTFHCKGTGKSKSESKQAAAAKLLMEIKSNDSCAAAKAPNYVVQLHELVQKKQMKKPVYTFQEFETDKSFECTIQLETFQSKGQGKSKNAAKLMAATNMLKKFQEPKILKEDSVQDSVRNMRQEAKAKQMTSPSDLLSKSGDQEKILYIPEHDELPKGWPDPLKHDPLRIKVIKIPETEDGKQMKNLFEGAASGKYRIYPMLNSSRSIALIINNMDFQQARTANVNLADRKGSEYDQMALDMLFEQLGFKRVIRKDCTVQVMLDAVHEQVSVAGSTPQDCFVFVVLSHGERDHVFGVDGEKVHLDKFEEAVDSPLLINKPKLLFIQACQGDRGDTGIRHDGGKEISSQMPEMQNLHLREESDGASPQWVPSRADIFSAKATVPNYFSWRNVNWGTWFIQAVVFVFSNFAYKYDLTSLMIMVNDLVKKAKAGNFRQISTFTCSHTHSLYFFPGLTHSPLS